MIKSAGTVAIMRTMQGGFALYWFAPDEKSWHIIDTETDMPNFADAVHQQFCAWAGTSFNGAFKGCRTANWSARPPMTQHRMPKAPDWRVAVDAFLALPPDLRGAFLAMAREVSP